MVFVYRDIILVSAIAVSLGLILLTLLVPVAFRSCYNRFKCCRGCCRCRYAKPKDDYYEDVGEWVTTKGASPPPKKRSGGGDEGESERYYGRLFQPSLFAQVFVYLCIGFIFIAICALSDVPFYVMWVIFFLVWVVLFIDFLKRIHARQVLEDGVGMKPLKDNKKEKKFDAYEAAGIKRSHFKRDVKKYFLSCWLALKAYKLEFLAALFLIIIISGITTISTSCMCVAVSPLQASTFVTRYFAHKYCVPGSVCNVYFTLADTEADLIMNFHASEKPDFAYVAYDVTPHEKAENETL